VALSLLPERYKSLIVARVGKVHLTWDVCGRYGYNGFRKILVWGWNWFKLAEGKGKGKRKFNSRTGHEVPEGE
jgi:hypothetical protein